MRQFFGTIFHGMGRRSSFLFQGLRDRLDYGHSILCGMQQGPCEEEDREEIRDIIRDIAASFGYNIEFKGDTLYPPQPENMKQPSPRKIYIIRCMDGYERGWRDVKISEFGDAIGIRDYDHDCHLTEGQATDALNFLTHGHTAYLDCPNAPCGKFGKNRFYAIFPVE